MKISKIANYIVVERLGFFDKSGIEMIVDNPDMENVEDTVWLNTPSGKLIARKYDFFKKSDGSEFANKEEVKTYFDELLKDAPSPFEYEDVFEGRFYIQKGRWYGFHPTYGKSLYQAYYNYRSSTFETYPNNLTYAKATGSRPKSKCKLKAVVLSFNYASADIKNLQIAVNKMSVTSGSSVVVNKTLLHEKTKEEGHEVLRNKYYEILLEFNEDVTPNDFINIFINSSDASSSRRYLYGCIIKFIYE